jgi:hypothetical protein
MQRDDEKFREQLRVSKGFEDMFRRWAWARGNYVLPTSEYSGFHDDKAPRLEAPPGSESLVLPDFLLARERRSMFVELKYKQKAVTWRKTGQRRTGFARRLFEHYQTVESVTGLPVYVLFMHEEEDEIRGQYLKQLEPIRQEHEVAGFSRMVFFDYVALPVVAKLSAVRVRYYRNDATPELCMTGTG